MRGEETQLLARSPSIASLSTGKQLVCMPGTHTKWVSLERQRRAGIPHGAHGRAVRDAVRAQRAGARPATPIDAPSARLRARLAESADIPRPLAAPLFQSRSLRSTSSSRRRRGIVDVGTAHRHRCRGALSLFHDMPRTPVYVIGAPQLTDRMRGARAHGRTSIQIDGAKAALAGLGFVYRELERAES
jgi:2-dehydro-3-deoxygalactonokinase